MDLETVEQQLKNAGVPKLVFSFSAKSEVKLLSKIMDDDEVIKYATSGSLDSDDLGDGTVELIVCTNKRVIFLSKRFLFGSNQSEVGLDSITGVSFKKRIFEGDISIASGNQHLLVKKVRADTVSTMAKAIKNAVAAYKNRGQSPVTAAPTENDSLSKLRELKGLLDDGIITQAEFDAKKKQLLNL
ncbi:PH domain-containing protein [Lactobacillus sp. ESL0677]|uniref:PH domain-containing protein n=1 Tax=Lactobacillus sp. ESL0677 TaxID=2983208 RepID=UPI0023F7EBCB|nr:PH domain-containing protein [Lactobacillus sp. ESL0677]WEV37565.1 PH domain-containing protein [Lactobacillus sp. ESL0677]